MFGWLFGKKTKDTDKLVCVACDSADVTELAPQTYRCNVCAYEGGDGYAAWQDMKTRSAYDDWTVERLRKHAAAQLDQARTAFAAVDGYVVPQPGQSGVQGNIGGVTVSIGGNFTGQSDHDSRIAMLARIRDETAAAAAQAAVHLRAATLTLDALVDKGAVELSAVLTDAKNPTDDPAQLRQRIESCLQQIG